MARSGTAHLGIWRRRIYAVLLILGVAVLVALSGSFVAKFSQPMDDFTMYWSATRLLLRGRNPYSPQDLPAMQAAMGRTFLYPPLMFNPPWAFTLLLPFSLLPYAWARLLWMTCTLVLVLASSILCWRLYGGEHRRFWIAWLLALSYFPLFPLFLSGQIGAWVLLGVVGFLYAMREEHWWLAGACTALIALKPQLMALFWIALVVWAVRHRMWAVIGGAVAGALAMSIIPLTMDMRLPFEYLDVALHHPPRAWMPPTIGTLLRLFAGPNRFWLQFVPLGFGILWFVPHWRRQSQGWDWPEQLPLLLLVGFATSVYSWSHDHIVLLLAVIQGAALLRGVRDRRSVVAIGLYALIDIAAWLSYGTTELYFVWLAPALLGLYLGTRVNGHRGRDAAAE